MGLIFVFNHYVHKCSFGIFFVYRIHQLRITGFYVYRWWWCIHVLLFILCIVGMFFVVVVFLYSLCKRKYVIKNAFQKIFLICNFFIANWIHPAGCNTKKNGYTYSDFKQSNIKTSSWNVNIRAISVISLNLFRM